MPKQRSFAAILRRAAAIDFHSWDGRDGRYTISAAALGRQLGIPAWQVRYSRNRSEYAVAFQACAAEVMNRHRERRRLRCKETRKKDHLNQPGVTSLAVIDNLERELLSEARERWPEGQVVISPLTGEKFIDLHAYVDHLLAHRGLLRFASSEMPELPKKIIGPNYFRLPWLGSAQTSPRGRSNPSSAERNEHGAVEE